MTDLRQARDDVLTFSQLIGHELAEWQADALRLERRTTVVVAPRQSGKSRSLSVLALWWAYRRPRQRVLIVSAGEDAARRLLAEASSVAVRSLLLSTSVVDENSGLLVLSNASEVRSVPASERQIRGWSVDLLLVDECALVDDELLLGAALPTTAARPDARVVLAGSPGAAEGAFYRFAEDGFQGGEHVQSFRWQLPDAEWIAADVVAGAREQLAPAQFAREYLGEFADVGAEERVIDRGWIAAAQLRAVAQATEVVYGLDVARRGGDESVLVSVRRTLARTGWDEDVLASRRDLVVRVAWASRGLDLMELSGRVRASVGAAPVWVDAIGLGFGVVDRLSEQRVHVVPFVASGRASNPLRYLNLRSEAWWHAREMFRQGLVDLDAGDRLLGEQLGGVRYKLASSGAVQIQAKDEMRTSPDRADALVIGLWAARQSIGAAELAQLAASAARAPVHPLLVGSAESELARLIPSGSAAERLEQLWRDGAGRTGNRPAREPDDFMTRPW